MANSKPTLTGLTTPITFLENTVNAAPQIIDADVTFTDADNNFNGGTLTVTGLLAEDSVAIRNQGAGAGQIGISGGNVTFGGTVIGSFTGGAGSTLSVTFNASATAGGIEALIENLTYANSSNTPTASRSLELKVTDAAGFAASAPITFAEQTGAANPFNGVNVGFRSKPSFADLDGDGDLDASVGVDLGQVHYFENTGSATAPTFTERTGAANPFNGVDVGYTAGPSFADLDSDGDLDAIIGDNQGALHYLQNTGSATAPTFTERTGAANPFNGVDVGGYSTPSFADLDGDGDLDAIVGKRDGTLNYFQNTGTALAPAFTEQTGAANPFNGVDVGDDSNLSFADLDGDGDLDAFVGARDGTLRYFENTGTATAPAFTARTGAANPFDGVDARGYSTPSFADLDGDGDLDLVSGEINGALIYFRNTTPHQLAPQFTQQTGAANPLNGIDAGDFSTPAFGDLDGDGDLDAAVGEYSGTLRYYRNTGTAVAPAFTEQTGVADPFNGVDVGRRSAPSFADLDGDGDLDAVVGERYGTLHYFENTGSAVAPAFTERTGAANPFNAVAVGKYSTPAFADLDGDGDLDAIVGDGDGLVRYFENTGTAVASAFTEQTGAANPFNGVSAYLPTPSFADLDGDGDLDAVVGQLHGTLRYFENTGSAIAPTFIERTGAANPFNGVDVGFRAAPTFVDLDGDGDLDAIMGASDGTLRYFENTGAGFTQVVNVTPENDPVITSNGGNATAAVSVAENSTAVTTVTATDADPGQTLSYTIVPGGDGTLFSIALTSGALAFKTAPNFEAPTDAGANNVYDVTVQVSDGAGGFDTQVISVTVTDVVTDAVLTGPATSVTFLENTVNGAPQIIDADVTFTASDDDFDTGRLTVTGLLAEDTVAIHNQGTGAGQIGVAGSDVSFGGTTIGSFTGGAGTTLTVTFNAAATAAGIEALIENLSYANSSDAPTASRTLEFKVSAAAGFAAIAPITFVEQTGAANPLNGIDVGLLSTPSFADLDGDGDLDVLVGNDQGVLHYFRNTGTAIAPTFVEQTGAANPFDGVDVGFFSKPSFADLDGDGDLDAVVGSADAFLRYFENTGSAIAPVFTQQTGAANPVNGVPVLNNSTPSFADLDSDGDLDAVIGESDGILNYFENTGSAIEPAFTARTGAANPFNGVDVGINSTPSFADLDDDGDLDAVVGDWDGNLHYFENTGSAIAPAFTARTGAANPFNGVDVGTASTPSFADLDDDGDLDAVVGEVLGILYYFRNTGGGFELVVNVTAENDAPTITSNGGNATAAVPVAENGTAVTTVTATDPDAGATLSYTIVPGGDGSLFSIGLASGVLAFTVAPNFEAPADAGANNVYDVTVQVSDGAGGIDTQVISVTVTDVNAPPVITSPTAATAVENASTSAVVYAAAATDDGEDSGSMTFSLSAGGDNDLFKVDAATGEVTFKTSPNYEAPGDANGDNVYDIVVRASDGVLTTTKVVAITVTDVNAAPTITSGATAAAAENVSTSTVVYDAAATDDGEDSGSVTFSLSAGGENNLFKIDAATGEVTFRTSPNFEAPGDAGADNVYDIVVRASDGVLTSTKDVSITVTDVNAAPVITSPSTATVAENVSTAMVVYDASAQDDGEDSGSVTFSLSTGGDNDLFKIDATTGAVTFKASPNFDAPGDLGGDSVYDIVVRASDGVLASTKAVSITVTNVNEAPEITSGSTATVAENVSTSTVVYDAAAQDGEGDNVIFSLLAGGERFRIDAATGEVTFKASPDYEAPRGVGGGNVYDIIVRASDGVQATTKTVSITVTDVNEAPVITSSSTATVAENLSTSAVVYDAAAQDAEGDSVIFSLAAGSDADLFWINAATGVVTFRTSPDYEAPGDADGDNVYDIVVRASDGALATTRAVAITVTDVNTTPEITSASTATVAENVSTSMVVYDAAAQDDGEDSGIVTFSLSAGGDNDLFDIDATTGEVTFKISPNFEAPGDAGGDNVYDIVVGASDGVLSTTKAVSITVTNVNAAPVITSASTATVAENVSASMVVYDAAAQDDGEDSGSVTFSLSAGGDNALFDIDATTGEITFKVSPNFEAPGDAGANNVYDIVVQASDGVLTTTKAVSISVTNLNAAPVIVSGATAAVAENMSTATVVYAAAAQDDGEDSGSVIFSLSAGGDNDFFNIDATTGQVTFKVSPDFEASSDVGGNNVYDIVVQASDGALTTTKAVAITVTNVNAAPVIVSGATATVVENVSTATVVYAAAAQDDGEDSGSVIFSLSAGGDNDLFNIDATTGEVTFKASPNYEAPRDAGANNVYDIVVEASDGALTTTKAVSISATNLNAAPVIVSGATATVVENVSTATVVYAAAAQDDGEDSGNVICSLSAGGDNDLFNIDATTGKVTFKASPDFEVPSDGGGNNVYDIVVQASDGVLASIKTVAITVTNVNAAPAIVSGSTATVAENVSTSTEVYKVSVTDDGESGSAVTFSLGGGIDDSRFTIDSTTGAVTFKASPDYEAPADAGADNVYDIVVQASDGLLTTMRSVQVTVTNVNAAPAIVSGATATVAENVSTSTEVYKASVTDDGESGSAITFSLGGGADDSRFTIDPTTGAVTFKASPDYEAPSDEGTDNVYDIVVQASDGLATTIRSVQITVTNVNAAPMIVSGATATVAENVSTSTEVYKASVTDDGESGSAITFSLAGGIDDNRFTIGATTGGVTFKVSPDYEAPSDAGADNVYDIVVLASDGLQTTARAVSITVTNVNAAPVIVSGATATVAENVSTSTEVYKTSVTDDGESGSAVTFSLGGADDSRFTIDPTTGAVTFKASPDYEAPSDAGTNNVYDIVVQAGDGLSTTMRSVSITVSNVVEATNAVDDAYVLIEGSTLIAGPTSKLLLNDDISGVVSTAVIGGPDHGTLQVATDGGFSYVPDAGFSGIDSFEYGIVDGSGIGHIAEARVYVTPVNVGATTTLDLLALTVEEQVAATYVAVLGRAADAGGFTFWVDQFNDNLPTQGPDLLFANIASSFGISGEATALYPFLANPFGAGAGLITDFVESVYNNLFNRSSDAGGLAYWTGQVQQTLASGRFVGSVLVDIISGAQDTAAGRDITTLMGKVAVSLDFVREQQESNMQWLGSSDVAAAKQLLDAVSSDQASVLMGVKNADNLVELHP